MSDLAVIILVRNEELHIERAIRSVQGIASQIFVVDSGSTDQTLDIARSLGADVFHNDWLNYATQVNWALDNCPIQTSWVMRLDADEYVLPGLAKQIVNELTSLPETTVGVRVPRRMVFMGRWMRFGGVGERLMLRIWRNKCGRSEERWMDEHIILSPGDIVTFVSAIVDENLNSLSWWVDKHNRYASREAIDQLCNEAYGEEEGHKMLDGQARRIRFLKSTVYARFPAFVRAILLFLYRYILLGGFLDGRAGAYFHFFQSGWYRALVDAKVWEVQRSVRNDNLTLEEAIKERLGFEISPKTPTESNE